MLALAATTNPLWYPVAILFWGTLAAAPFALCLWLRGAYRVARGTRQPSDPLMD
jgi:hypothetical protein